MVVKSIPDNFAPLDGGLVYELAFDGEMPCADVAVVDVTRSRVAARLRFSQTAAVKLDIAPYVVRMFDAAPESGPTGLRTDLDRTVEVAVEVNGERTPVRTFTLFAFDGLARLLTLLPADRTIATGEFDEIALYAPEGAAVTVVSEPEEGNSVGRRIAVPPSRQIQVLRVAADDFPQARRSLSVKFDAGGRVEELRYDRVRRTPESVRVAWLASSGAVEYYTFPTCRRRTLKVEKSAVYSRDGYRTSAVRRETVLQLVSDFEPRSVAAALEEILSSPKVWVVAGDSITEADVLSSTISYRSDGAPAAVTVEIRSRRREEALQ